jgi:hypothetical protein
LATDLDIEYPALDEHVQSLGEGGRELVRVGRDEIGRGWS